MAKKIKKKNENETPERKGTARLLDEIISESLSPDANLILIEGKIRELERSERSYLPLLLKKVILGKAKEQKVILDFLVRRKTAEVIRALHSVSRESMTSIRIRNQAMVQLTRWGEGVDETLQKQLGDAEELILILEKHAAFGEPLEIGVERAARQRYQELRGELKFSVIRELLREYAHGLGVVLKLIREEQDLDERIVLLIAEQESEEVAEFFCTLMVTTTNNKLRKVIKKALFQMRGKGVEFVLPPVEEEKAPSFPKAESRQSQAFVTSIDYLGDRMMFISKSVLGWGMVFFQITMGDQEGLKSLSAFNLNRRETKNFLDRVSKEGIIQLVDIPPEYSYFLIDEAYKVNLRKGMNPPEHFNYWKVELDELKGEVTRPIIYGHVPQKTLGVENRELWRAQYHTIVELDLFKEWFLEPRFVWEYVEKVNAIATSPFVLNPYQVDGRKESVIAEALERVFADDMRLCYQRRLEEMAYILFRRGAEDSARIVLLAAVDLGKDGISPREHGFLRSLVMKSIQLFLRDAGEKQKDRLIISPS